MTPEEKAAADLKAAEEKAIAQEKRIKDLEFNNMLSETLTEFPLAKEFKDKIRAKWDSGMDISDAAVVVLQKEGKLGNKEIEVPTGTSAQTVLGGEKQPQNAEEWAKQFQELEAKGEIRLDA